MMGTVGLRQATLVSILNANYMAKRLEPYYPVVYKGKEGLVAHECIIDIRPLKKSHNIDVTDIAKRLMDYGFHAPTMSWPVTGTLMIEPTESENKKELDRFCDAMIEIRKEADSTPDILKNAPHTAEMLLVTDWKHNYSREKAAYPLKWVQANKYWPPVGRVDNAFGDKNIVCSCPSVDEYKQIVTKKKVVCIRLDKIGDLICTLPVDQILDDSEYDITWIVQKGLGSVVVLGSKKRKYLELDKKDPGSASKILKKFLKEFKPDIAISFQGPWWVNFELFKARIPTRSGVYSQWHSFLFLNHGLRQKRSQALQHEFDYNKDLVLKTFSLKDDKRFHYFEILNPNR